MRLEGSPIRRAMRRGCCQRAVVRGEWARRSLSPLIIVLNDADMSR